MVVIEVKLWPKGDRTLERLVGRAEVELVAATEDGARGDYAVRLAHAGKFQGKSGWWKTGGVKGYARELSPYHLVLAAMAACLKPLGHARGAATGIIAWLESFEERAAILEFEAGLERAEAERRALEMVGPPPTSSTTKGSERAS